MTVDTISEVVTTFALGGAFLTVRRQGSGAHCQSRVDTGSYSLDVESAQLYSIASGERLE